MRHALAAAAVLALSAIAPACFAQASQAKPPSPLLMTQELAGQPGKEVRVLTVTASPGSASAAHRHNGQVFVYMLEGTMIMQVQGQPPVTLLPGQTFYESPADIHVVSKNPSATQPAKFLAMMIMDKGAPTVVPVK